VALSALVSHAVKLDAIALTRADTALKLLIVHALALLLLRLPNASGKHEFNAKLAPALALVGLSFSLGTLFFSGSLLAAALSGVDALTTPAPFGGSLLMFGWLLWGISIWRGR
jgi:uncharacterized membrane protein YgdD (TMEM256/DUF423 family)